MPTLARFHAVDSPDLHGWEIRDRQNGDARVEFVRSIDHHWPESGTNVRAWTRVLNRAAVDQAEAIFELARLTGQPTAVTREVVAEALDGQYPIAVPR